MDNVIELPPNAEIEDMLVLEQGVKNLIVQMISGHDPSRDVDFVSGKGRGLIFLLSGPPGCGKTLTAGKKSPTESQLYSILNTH